MSKNQSQNNFAINSKNTIKKRNLKEWKYMEQENASLHLCSKISLLMLNNKALAEGLICEDVKRNIDNQIEISYAKG